MFANHSGSPASFPAFLPAAIYWAHGIPDCVPHWSTVDKTDKLSVLFELNFGWKDRQNPSTQMHAQLWSCWENLLWVGWSAWGIPGTEEPGGLPSMGLHRVGHDWNDLACMHAWIEEGNGNPFQYSCLENPRDRGAWWAAVCGVAQSWTWPMRLSSSSSSSRMVRKDPSLLEAVIFSPLSIFAISWMPRNEHVNHYITEAVDALVCFNNKTTYMYWKPTMC